MTNRTRRPPVHAPQVVVLRRVAPLAPRPEFVRVGPTAPRTWIEPLEARRVLSSATAAVMIPRPIMLTDPSITADTTVDDSTDDGSVNDGTIDDGSTDDGSTGDTSIDDTGDSSGDGTDTSDEQPTTEVWTSTTFIDVVDGNGNVLQSLKVVSSDFGDGSGEDPVQYAQLTADELDPSQLNLQVGQTVVTSYDDNGETVTLAAVPTTALPGTWVDATTRIASDGGELSGQRAAYEAELARENTPTDQASQRTQYVDVVDDAGNVVQSFRIVSTVFGEDAPNAADVSYMQVSAGDTSWLVPTTLAAGQSATWTWNDETGDPILVDGVPATALPDSEYDTATSIASDDPQLVAAREADNAIPSGDPIDWSGDWGGDWRGDGFGELPYVCYLPAASGGGIEDVGGIADAGGIETMLGGGVLASDATSADPVPSDATPAPSDATSTSVDAGTAKPLQIPLPSLPAVANRPLSDVLTAGKKHDDVLDPADASLTALVR